MLMLPAGTGHRLHAEPMTQAAQAVFVQPIQAQGVQQQIISCFMVSESRQSFSTITLASTNGFNTWLYITTLLLSNSRQRFAALWLASINGFNTWLLLPLYCFCTRKTSKAWGYLQDAKAMVLCSAIKC